MQRIAARRLLSSEKTNKFSSRITEPKQQGASQAMLIATGLSREQLKLPQVGIASVWYNLSHFNTFSLRYEGNPCNMHLLDLAAAVKKGVQDAGLVGLRFNTIGVSVRSERESLLFIFSGWHFHGNERHVVFASISRNNC
jgi:dihydroxyacid dehydratase/phosphogluconate dehydratase